MQRGVRDGFSLIELLITIAIIVVLMVVMYGGNSRSRQLKKIKVCARQLGVIHTALQLYGSEHEGQFPETSQPPQYSDEPLALLVPQYTSLTAPFICPGSGDKRLPEGTPFAGRRISYSYYMGLKAADGTKAVMSDWQVDSRLKVPGDPLFSADGKPPGNNHGQYGGNVLFVDGHVEKTPPRAQTALPLAEGVKLLNPRP